MKTTASIPNLAAVRTSPGVLLARVSGNWREGPTLPSVEVVRETLSKEPSVKSVEFDTAGLTGWDSRFVAFISQCAGAVRGRNIEIRYDGLPEGARRLLRLAHAVPEKVDAHRAVVKASFFRSVGEHTIQGWDGILGLFTFLGQNLTALVNLLRGRAQFRWADTFQVMEQTGPQALGIVAMINFLVGLILAFVGALELERFGASIYVADLVGIATVREMGCIMTGIILCGRTGAAFAAQLGTMKVNEEINALQTFGFSPIEFLVLPRMVALVLMMPFLCVFADLISIAGGFFVSVSMLDITSTEYVNRTMQAIQLKSFLLGIVKGTFFGFLVAYTGCLRGMQCGHTAAAVGQATTRAVVSGISAIIASDGLFAVLCNALQI
ncbi:MAG TPA: ABC transporter permease [Candidatus Limnocylindrales bacterium]|jgi:phospholipid/cholesterol/gamma-HCH transport system permease protein|nr:ABC transporter permease [Candidatus Limnocylindrales bacterium]